MLVLGCTNHQSVVIDENIRVTVINNIRGRVILGIDVPEGIQIHHEDTRPQDDHVDHSQNMEI